MEAWSLATNDHPDRALGDLARGGDRRGLSVTQEQDIAPMNKPEPKPPILRSRRGVLVLVVVVAILFVILYLAIGATAFLRTQAQGDPDPSPPDQATPAAQSA